jgi:adenine-specific DNA-methyltransferase
MFERQRRNPASDFCWRWSRDLFDFGYKNGFIVIKENGSDRIYTKTYQNATISKNENGYYIEYKQRTKSLSSLDFVENKYSNDNSKKDLSALFKENVFDYSKPVSLLKKLAFVSTGSDDIFLDFFSGSRTAGQAITELNEEDGGSRRFMLVQIPESIDEKSEAYLAGYKKISDITIERNKRVVNNIIAERKKQKPDLFASGGKDGALKGLGFKVFKLVKSNFPRVEWAPDPEKTTEENIEGLKKYIRDKEAQLVTVFNKDELITEILLKKGFKLNYKTEIQPQFRKNDIYLVTDESKKALICLDGMIDMDTVDYFKKHTDMRFICLERALDTTRKWNLKHYLGENFIAF